jgi:hypothetical protein
MRLCGTKAEPAPAKTKKGRSRNAFFVAAVALIMLRPFPGHTQSQSASPAASQAPAQPQGSSQTQSKKATQPAKTSQDDPTGKPSTVADAARKANAAPNKPKAKHVFTNDDLSGLGGGVSVVGSDRGSAVNENSNAGLQGRSAAPSGDRNEAYWRQRARAIKDQIEGIDQQIDKVKQEIAKSGPASFDPTTSLTQNVIVLHDRNADLQRLQERKQNLEKQLDDLTDEGRKAGADPGWFR